MRSLFLAAGIILVMAGSVIAQPKIEIVGGDTFDWGKVEAPKSGYLETTLKIKNVGNQLLKLTEVKPGCGCTKTDPDKTELKPGEVSTMQVKLNIYAMQSGQLIKNITVRSNDPGADSVKYLFLKADILRKVQISPMAFFSFINPYVNREMTARLEVLNNDTKDLKVYDFVVEGEMKLSVTEPQVIKPGGKLELILTTTPKQKGAFNGNVKFKTNNEENPDFTIAAYANVQDAP